MGPDLNAFDYFFSDSKTLTKDFLLGIKENISFLTLHQKCIAIAEYLQDYIGKGKNIPVIGNNNLFFITSYLAIIKSGNIAIPLNPALEEETLDNIISQCECSCAFISAETHINRKGILKQFDESDVISIISEKKRIIDPQSNIDDPAIILFTSGSTGLPKGVMLSHRNLIANTSSIVKYLQLAETDIMLVVLPFYYCYGLSLLHTHLHVGGSIAINNSFIFLGGIIRDLNLYNCTGFAGVPSHYQILLRKSKSFITTQFPSLRYVTQAGGKLSYPFIEEFTKAFPEISFYVMYGQTEATARLAYLSPELVNIKKGSVGKEIPGVILKIVDDKDIEVTPGEIGEIIAHGENIMSGYFKDQALTSETVRLGWLYTGDNAVMDDEGYITILSRKKEIIKVGGKRVSPKEIEEVILLLPYVVDCTVQGIADSLLGEAVCATIILTEEANKTITEKDILVHCHKNLAMYKVPSKITFESSLTFASTGKKIKT